MSTGFAERSISPDPTTSAQTSADAAAAIFGCAGLVPTDEERAFFAEARPWGFILFARNIESPDQVRALVADLRAIVGWRAPVLIDQEGGRVARLRGPHWREWPPVGAWADAVDAAPASAKGEAALLEALRLRFRLIADELSALGIDVDCAPVLDMRRDEADAVIGDRALGRDPQAVARRGRAIWDGLADGGVLGVVKHLPGHGRADVDSHLSLPVVEADLAALKAEDFAPFRALADATLGMTAHIVYAAIDPDRCATLSPVVIDGIIRGEIGFDGLLMTDDLSMKALRGGFAERARDSLAAGCDVVLHCNGDMDEMAAIMRETPRLDGAARRRADTALARRGGASPIDLEAAERRLGAFSAEPPRAAMEERRV